MSKIYVLSQDQLKVLLLSCGFTQVKGITLGESIVDNQMTLNVLNDLMKSGLVKNTGESFYINDELKKIIIALGSAEEFSVIRSNDGSLPDLYCYVNESVLICSTRGASRIYYSLYFAKNTDLIETLENEGYLPNLVEGDYFDESNLELFEETLQYEPVVPLDNQMPVKFAMEKAIFSPENHRYIRVIEYYFFTYLLFYDKKKKYRALYNKNELKEKILKLLES